MYFESKRASRITTSPVMAISITAKAMRKQGREVMDLSVGEPDFDTPEHILLAAETAMRQGATHYTGPSGTDELREAIIRKFATENGLTFSDDQIAVGIGAKQILFNIFIGTLEPGDEVIVPAPYWASYTDIIRLHDGVPVVLDAGIEYGFKLSPERLEAAITPRTKWFLLNTPSNPSGTIYSREELRALGDVMVRHSNVGIVSDEIYEHVIIGSQPFVSFAQACPELADRTVIVNGVSKAYAMTGWRVGYAAGPRQLVDILRTMESQSTTCPTSISQAAAATALTGPQDFVREAVAIYQKRAHLLGGWIGNINGLALRMPDGAFYLYPECSGFIGGSTPDGKRISSSSDLCEYLLEEGGVATAPGSAFGLDSYFRLSFATDEETLARAGERITEMLGRIVKSDASHA